MASSVSKFHILIATFGVLLVAYGFSSKRDVVKEDIQTERKSSIAKLYAEYEKDLQGVPAVSVDKLIGALNRVLFIDVRTPKEREISIIPGSFSKEEFEKKLRTEPALTRDRTLVAYCTIGYRSGLYVKELIKRGITAQNLQGGVLSWAEEHQQFVTLDGAPTRKVHVYGKKWNLLPETYEATW